MENKQIVYTKKYNPAQVDKQKCKNIRSYLEINFIVSIIFLILLLIANIFIFLKKGIEIFQPNNIFLILFLFYVIQIIIVSIFRHNSKKKKYNFFQCFITWIFFLANLLFFVIIIVAVAPAMTTGFAVASFVNGQSFGSSGFSRNRYGGLKTRNSDLSYRLY